MHIELNIGLDAPGQENTQTTRDNRAAYAKSLASLVGLVVNSARYESTYQNPDGTDSTEQGIFFRINTNSVMAASSVLFMISCALEQDCISVYCPFTAHGFLVGPNSGKWGKFDLDFFQTPDAVKAA